MTQIYSNKTLQTKDVKFYCGINDGKCATTETMKLLLPLKLYAVYLATEMTESHNIS